MDPRARRTPLEGVVSPRARRSPLEGGVGWATPLGRGGRHGVGRALGVCLSEKCFVLVFFAGFKRDSPVCFRDPRAVPDSISLLAPSNNYCKTIIQGYS
jgi:hypothetical protein